MDSLLGVGLFVSSLVISAAVARCRSTCHREVIVDSLVIYPVKGCGPIYVNRAEMTPRGLQYDRSFLIIDTAKSNRFMSQRQYPRMALIATSIDIATNTLTLSHASDKSFPRLLISLASPSDASPRLAVTVWKDTCFGVDCGEVANKWVNAFLGTDSLALVQMAPECVRETSRKYSNGEVSFADGFPFLLASTESLDDLNSKLPSPVSMLNFRPNIIVRNVSKPWDEDNWGNILIGNDVRLSVVKPCSRCQVPNIDPSTGVENPQQEPSRTLKTYHCGKDMGLQSKEFQREVMFGQNVDYTEPYNKSNSKLLYISVGDRVEVLTTRPSWL